MRAEMQSIQHQLFGELRKRIVNHVYIEKVGEGRVYITLSFPDSFIP